MSPTENAAAAIRPVDEKLKPDEVADYYDTAAHYDLLWGKDNIHIGFYPHLLRKRDVVLDFPQAADTITRRLISLGDISHDSRVLDLGCGKGVCCMHIAELTGAACTGLDLSPENVRRAKVLAQEKSHLKLEFVEGSFTDLPENLHGRFTHIISQESFVHVHDQFPAIWEQVRKALAPGGKAVINDYLGSDDEVTEKTRKCVYDRLGFQVLLGHKAWRRCAEEAGMVLLHYENLDAHMAFAYAQLAEKAKAYDFKSADGTPLHENYADSSEAACKRQIGLNLAVYVVQ